MHTLLVNHIAPLVHLGQLYQGSILIAFALASLLLLGAGRLRIRLPRIKVRLRLPFKSRRKGFDRMPGGITAALAIFLAAFGVTGCVFQALHVSEPLSVIGASLAGVLFAGAFFKSVLALMADGGEHTGSPVIGKTAVVTLSIPSTGVGQIAYWTEGKRHVLPARASHERDVDSGTQVFITDVARGVAHVEEM